MWRFLEPRALWLFAPLAVGVIYFLVAKRSKRLRVLLPISGPQGLIKKYSQRTKWAYRILFTFTVLSFIVLILVIARPVEITPLIKKSGEGIDIAIVLDVSESMDADDLQPSRIDVAKAVIRDFIKRRTEDRIGIVIFSGEAVTKCPLTRDYDFLL
jgi:Ca-activated chloride channel family protein